MIKWIYNPYENGDIIKDEEGKEVAYPTAYNTDVVKRVVELWNSRESLDAIEDYLKDEASSEDGKCNQEECDYMMEMLTGYLDTLPKVKHEVGKAAVVEFLSPTQEKVATDAEKMLTGAKVLETVDKFLSDKGLVTDVQDPINQHSIIIGTENASLPEKKTRQKRVNTTPASGKVSVEEIKSKLLDKIALLEALDSTRLDIDTQHLSKANKEILVQYQSEVDAILDKYLLAAQNQ